MTKQMEREKQDFLKRESQMQEAIIEWRKTKPESYRHVIPSQSELVSFLSNQLRLSRLALKAAIKHINNHNSDYHHNTPARVIQLWEKTL